jgi:hypothetical protein
MLPEVDTLSLHVVATIVEVLNRWRRTHSKELHDCLIESLEELISAIQAEPNDDVAKVGEHFVTIFLHWWKLWIAQGMFSSRRSLFFG